MTQYKVTVEECLQFKEYPDSWYAVNRAVLNNDLETLRSLCNLEAIQEEMAQKIEEINALFRRCSDYKVDPVSDEKVREELKLRVNRAAGKGLTPLHIAATTNNVAAAQILVDTGVCEVNKRDYKKATALHHAAVLGHQDMIQFLLKQGADKTARDFSGKTYQEILTTSNQKIEVKLDSGDIFSMSSLWFNVWVNP